MLSSLFWVDIFGYSLYVAIVKNNKNIHEKHIKYLCFGFGIPLIISIIPYFMELYGPAGSWCWIMSISDYSWESNIIAYIEFYLPL
jgi:hypothetical protein